MKMHDILNTIGQMERTDKLKTCMMIGLIHDRTVWTHNTIGLIGYMIG